jgi:MinD superfamily P-loop ATPase
VVVVTEPTAAGIHDMLRVLDLAAHFTIPSLVCINKADLYPEGAEEIESFCRENGIQAVGRIPFDLTVASAMVQGEAVTVFRPEAPASLAISAIWEQVLISLLDCTHE